MDLDQLNKAYEPQEVESKIYDKWIEKGYFNPDNLPFDTKEHFFIPMPPPNVTGVLHLGHALENVLMDIQTRYQRMLGKKVLLVPGADHAAVATQAKVEKILIEQGIENPREHFGREELLKQIRVFADDSKKTIISQIKKIGTSCDWSRFVYTFDEKRSEVVNEVFERMYNDKLVYKGYRVINWSVKGQSTCSDDELEYSEQQTKMYTFKYSKDFPISIATTRPETKLGDTAVAVNPKDERYKQYIGQEFMVDVGALKPLTIKIIGDDEIDMEYGTGAVGVTPAHSMVDYDMYTKHGLELIQVIGIDGLMTENAGKEYQGLNIVDAREKFVGWLKEKNLLEKEEEIINNVSSSDRFKDVVEILPMEQWFIDVNKEIPNKGKTLKDSMKEAVTVGHNNDINKKINITPERFVNQYLSWIDNLRDWCISRQIWWGHRIPVWYCKDCSEVMCSRNGIETCSKCSSANIVQDEDTLDTWFSSGTWTFSILGGPTETEDMKNYHPASWIQMGYELIFFWMARMVLMTTYVMDDIPFKDMYFHGMLKDEQGRKFSKSLGNGINPIEVCDKYGTDALRLNLITGITSGGDSRFSIEKVEAARNFVNKLWNVSRYIFTNVEKIEKINKKPEPKTLADKWILANLSQLIVDVTGNLNKYQFSAVVEDLKSFTWDNFADWYVEIAKIEGDKDEILLYVLQNLLVLWHPFIPFVTENIWENIDKENLLVIEKWAQTEPIKNTENEFEKIKEIITAIRNVRGENKIEQHKKVKSYIVSKKFEKIIKDNEAVIAYLSRSDEIFYEINLTEVDGSKFVNRVLDGVKIYVSLEGAIDVEKEKEKTVKEIENFSKLIVGINKKLDNKEFVGKAPETIVKKENEKRNSYQEQLDNLKSKLEALN